MNADGLVAALGLPDGARVDRRVPKTLLTEHGAPTPADKRRLNEEVDTVTWLAALKPSTVGIPEFRDDTREYLEIAVLRMALREKGHRAPGTTRLVELVHRAVPYPVILIADDAPRNRIVLSAAHKRWSQTEAGQTVLCGDVVAVDWMSNDAPAAEFERLALARQPQASMLALYQGWMDTLAGILATRVTGAADPPARDEGTDTFAAIREWEDIGKQIDRLRADARKERQMARQVELNLTLKRLEARRAAIRQRLQ